jgi:hypothetical protein
MLSYKLLFGESNRCNDKPPAQTGAPAARQANPEKFLRAILPSSSMRI